MLLDEILISFKIKDYRTTLDKIDEYMSHKENGMFAKLFDIYIKCHIKLELYYTAGVYIDMMPKLFPGYYDACKMATLYAECGLFFEANEIIKNTYFTRGELVRIAKAFFYKSEYDTATELFERCLVDYKTDHITVEANGYLNRIKEYNKIKKSIKTNYADFKANGNELEEGHMVYIKELNPEYEENCNIGDHKQNCRPYMVWKILDDKIYAFPITKAKPKFDHYVLFHQNYPDCTFDRTLKDRLVVLEDKDIMRVVGKVNKKDYEIILKNMYVLLCRQQTLPRNNIKAFVEYAKSSMNINVNDVLIVYDTEVHKKRYYFLIDDLEETHEYRVVELECNNRWFEVVGSPICLSKDICISNKVIIDEANICSIQNQLSVASVPKTLLGRLVRSLNLDNKK